MKALVFHIGVDRYGLPLGAVERVLPVMELKQLPQVPALVAGVMDLHGDPVLVIDLARLSGLARGELMSDTRILLVQYPKAGRLLGLLADQVEGIVDVDDATLKDDGIAGPDFLGQVAPQPQGLLQLIVPGELLDAQVRALLYPPVETPA
jgi:chemotaxis-related protein WspB